MGDDISDEDDRNVFLGVRECVLTGSEEIEDWVNEDQGDGHEDQSYDDVQTDYVS